MIRCLLLSETNSLLDSPGQFLGQRVVSLVRREIQTVETCVRFGQLGFLARLLDGEATRAVRSLEVFEAVDGDSGSSGGELKETGLLLGVPAANAL
jgi:hypothetical protein